MPSLPLPPLPKGVPIDAGALPVQSQADVAAEWAPEVQLPQTAPNRDAMQSGQTAALLEYQRRLRYAAAQSDPLRATDEYQDEIGSYERGVHRQNAETNDAYRARYLTFQSVVSPSAILAAATAVLAPYTTKPLFYAESSDGWFLNDGTSTWSSHLFDAPGNVHQVPNYPDRLYPDATGPGLVSIPSRRPPGAMPVDDTGGRWFLLRVPDISVIDTLVAAAYDTAPTSGDGFFPTDGVGNFGGVYLYDFSATANDVYNAAIGAVNAIVGQSIRWSLVVDPYLVP